MEIQRNIIKITNLKKNKNNWYFIEIKHRKNKASKNYCSHHKSQLINRSQLLRNRCNKIRNFNNIYQKAVKEKVDNFRNDHSGFFIIKF
jgi:hypothetical protein